MLFFAYKLQALHLSEKPCGKLAFRNGSSDRYWAQARDRDEAERSRGAQQGLKRMQDAPVRRRKHATEMKQSKGEVRSRRISQYSE